ncbi:hypothetical protein [Polaribacter cellanae]|uniref:Uncharacterized protein n=1 Tax=Polaribacter cellanae TaxID=2818493 RepID=A0A975CUX1_9FLAO|nr:hypothetical protein [Polaribacter cellanae]QTE23981.1 hypothetical protein J3359_06855 [Polaribacter cellanae]
MKKYIFTIGFLLISLYTFGQQKKIKNYKYIVVPEKFEFLKKADQYQTSSLTKFLLEKNGFQVYLSSEDYPEDLQKNRCLALFADVVDKSSLFKIKTLIQLKDCFNKVVYTSKEGGSNIKNYKKGYQEAIRNAHKSMRNIRYVALPENNQNSKGEVAKKVAVISKKVEKPVKVISEVSPITNQKQPIKTASNKALSVLYAQAKENGFQLINTKPEVVFLLLNTNVKEVFIIKDKNGILYKNANSWVAEYYKNGKLITEEYLIKF